MHTSILRNISALSELTGLELLILSGNQISDISALSKLTGLALLDLQSNPLVCSAYCSVIPLIRQMNPGLWIFLAQLPAECECEFLANFRRGDTNADGKQNLTDAVFVLDHLFGGGDAPPCAKSADANDSGTVDLTDTVFLLNFLFAGGQPPPTPFSECGLDPTIDDLTCESFEGCQ